MSDTPRTDATLASQGSERGLLVHSNFARQLERELNAALEANKQANANGLELAKQVTSYLGCGPEDTIQGKIDEMRERIKELEKDKTRLTEALDKIGFYFAGTENQRVSDLVLLVIRGLSIDSAIAKENT